MKIPAAAQAPRGFFLAVKRILNAAPIPVFLAAWLLLLSLSALAQDQVTDPQPGDQSNQSARLMVYKKWIGGSGDEANVTIELFCPQEDTHPTRFINRDHPEGWVILNVPAEGFVCSVRELERETFIADASDCINLFVLPEQEVECTMVNTKVVKRIEMFNRYGLTAMIIVMLAAGLITVRRFTPM